MDGTNSNEPNKFMISNGSCGRDYCRPRAGCHRILLAALLAAASVQAMAGSAEIESLQRLVEQGAFPAASAMGQFQAELEKNPENPRLLYNHAVAAYAAGRFEDALLSLDKVESRGSRKLIRKAQFQKGNLEFHLGSNAGTNNLDETISHWKQSLDYYREVLKSTPRDVPALTNQAVVRRLLTDLLLKGARESEKSAEQPNATTEKRLHDLRNSHERFDDAKETEPANSEATEGEERTRDKLAAALAAEGTRKANLPVQIKPNAREPSLPYYNLEPTQEGVDMLADANQLKPNNKAYQKALEQARHKLADGQTLQAQMFLSLEERIMIPKERLAVLRMAKENTQKALDQVPEHTGAKQTQEEIERRLAQIHEEVGDMLSQMSEHQNLENEAMMLSQSLENFQQAGELKPNEQRIQQKAQRTQSKLENALDQLADQLMQPQPGESMEQQIARLEGAQQALGELMGFKPSNSTAQRAEEVGNQLDSLRQQLAQQGRPMQAPGDQQQQLAQNEPQSQQGLPMDGPPRINTPGRKGPWSSPTMLRSLRDY
jgi:hypothetical protein